MRRDATWFEFIANPWMNGSDKGPGELRMNPSRAEN
jgi:hypothetical protein